MRIAPINASRSIVRVAPLEKLHAQRTYAPTRRPDPTVPTEAGSGTDPLAGLQTALAQVTADRLAVAGLTRRSGDVLDVTV